jgi:hypothetical protein
MINLGYCNVVYSTDIQPSWEERASQFGLDPSVLRCVTWHQGKPNDAVAFFHVRPKDPANYLVHIDARCL